MNASISNSYAKKLAFNTVRFRDKVVYKTLGKPGKIGNHLAVLFKILKSKVFPQLDAKEFASHYALTFTSLLLTASFLAGDKERRRDLKQCLRELMSVFHRASEGQEEKTLIVILEILKSIKRVYIPIRLKNTILETIDAFETVERGYEEEKYYLLLGFYEVFLEAYDPKLKKENGVFFTPLPVVSFIVRSLNVLLKDQLDRPGGLADQSAIILDPAAGTSTFLLTAARLAIHEYSSQNGNNSLKAFSISYLLNNLYGYEKLLPLCAVAFLNFAHFLKDFDLQLPENVLLNVFLQNAFLEGLSGSITNLQSTASLVPVVLGNPPYSRHPDNKIPWITEKIRDYYKMGKEGATLQEKNLKWLHDDYIRFIRFAQEIIDRNGIGIMGFITNNAFLDSPTFRAMRGSLMQSFSEIYILNLHGNAMKKEKCPDGGKDENIFSIRQGVAISFFVRSRGKFKECKVFYSDLWGLKQDKLDSLSTSDVGSVAWERISPRSDIFRFTPFKGSDKLTTGPDKYKCCVKVTDIFPLHSVGIVTARDKFTIKRTSGEVFKTVSDFAQMSEAKARKKFKLGQDVRDWSVLNAQEDIIKSGPTQDKVVPILYRPFDVRFTYYTGNCRGFHCMPRSKVMKHLLFHNLALITTRQVAEGEFNHCFVSDTIVDSRVTTSNRGICYVFPLYLYKSLSEKHANICPQFLDRLRDHLEQNCIPKAKTVFAYVYAVLNSPLYRSEFSRQLESEFPYVPFPSNEALFTEIAGLGNSLIQDHLNMIPDLLWFPFNLKDEAIHEVKNVRYVPRFSDTGRIFINARNYFSNVPKEVWDYKLCGYQILPKMIGGYKGRAFTTVAIEHVSAVIRSLRMTIINQEKIDHLFSQIKII